MPDINTCTFTGRLGRDPELRFTANQTPVAGFSLAVDDSYTTKDGNKVERTVWIDCSVWMGLAEKVVAKYCHKGDMVAVSGKLEQDEWQDKESGQKRTKLKLRVDSLRLCGGGNDGGEPRPAAQQQRPATPPQDPNAVGFGNDDVQW